MVSQLQRSNSVERIAELLGPDASQLLDHTSQTIPKENLNLPGPDFVDRVWGISDRTPAVLRSLQALFDHGRLAGTGYLSILPVDQGVEHSAGASFAPNPEYFDPENIIKLAMEGGCNAVASTFGVLGSVGRKYAHRIPFIVKIKQKLPQRNGGYKAVETALGGSYGKTSKLVYEKLTSDNPIDLVRYQVANCYMGRCGLINSGGESKGASDLAEAVRTAVINKRGGGTGLISGRKAFQRPMSEGVELLNAIQDVYLEPEITIA